MTTTILTQNVDFFTGDSGEDTILGLNGGDILNGAAGDDTIYGGDGNDILTGGTGADSLYGGSGIDTASYFAEDHKVDADLESDSAWVNGVKDTLDGIENLTGTEFSDVLKGNALANTLAGNFGADTLWGRGGNDKLYGGAANDSLIGGEGGDLLDGGSGRDKALYVFSGEGVIVNLVTGTGLGGEAQNDTLISIEDVDGSAHDDIITGNSLDNTIMGYGGNDTLSGGRGNDELMGGDGNDIINGGMGNDIIYATAGEDSYNGGGGFGYDSDTLSYMMSDGGVDIDLQNNSASGGFADDHTIVSIENLFGSVHGDTLRGNGFGNTLRGYVGDDEINGRGGADMLHGEHGNDEIKGGDGDDVIIGGEGRDVMEGDAGADRFVFENVLHSGTTNATRDIIEDFEQGIDKIDLSGFDGRPGTPVPGHQPLDFLGEDSFNVIVGHAELRFRHNDGRTIIEIDTDYDGVANTAIRLDGIYDLTLSDFIL